MKSTDIDQQYEDLRTRAKQIGGKRGLKEVADDFLKTKFSQLVLEAPDDLTSIAAKEHWARAHEEYREAIQKKKDWIADWAAEDLQMKVTFAEGEKYRTDRSYAKHVDRLHE